MAWLGDWRYRIKVILDSTKVDAALTNFPVLLHLSVAAGSTDFNITDIFDKLELDANRFKIAVTTSDGETQCYVEIEIWTDADEEAWLWVKVPSISVSADTILYIYYDKNESDNTTYVGDVQSTPGKAVWDSDFTAVYHMNNTPPAAELDSTSNVSNLAPVNMTDNLVEGQIGNNHEFDGSDEYENGADSFYSDKLTIEAWVEPDSFPTDRYKNIALKRNSAGVTAGTAEWYLAFFAGTGRRPRFIVWDSGGTDYDAIAAQNVFPVSGYGYIAGRAGGAGEKVSLVVNLTKVEGDVQTNAIRNTASLIQVASRSNNDNKRYFDGEIDEVRISKVARSDAWLKASYYSGLDKLVRYYIEVQDVGIPFGIRNPDVEDIPSMQLWLEDLYDYLERPDMGKLNFAEQAGNPDEPIADKAVMFLKPSAGKSSFGIRFNNAAGAADVVELALES